MDDDLHDRLREAAEAHRPDRERMLARVERGMAAPAGQRPGRHRVGRVWMWPRMVLASVAAAAAMAVGGLAVAAIAQRPEPPRGTTASPSATAPSGSPSPSASASGEASPAPRPTSADTAPGRSASGPPSAGASPDRGPVSPTPTGSRTEDGPLWVDGSVVPGGTAASAESDVTLKNRSPLTALTVELWLPLTDGVENTGHRQTLPTADFTVRVREENGVLYYRWTLRPGRTVPVGEHLFAAEYDHAAGGRDAKDDRYRSDAVFADGTASVWGDFARSTG